MLLSPTLVAGIPSANTDDAGISRKFERIGRADLVKMNEWESL
jgi:hypothetical protein